MLLFYQYFIEQLTKSTSFVNLTFKNIRLLNKPFFNSEQFWEFKVFVLFQDTS